MADETKPQPSDETGPDVAGPTPPVAAPPPSPPAAPARRRQAPAPAKAPRPPIVAVPAVLEAVAKAKKDRPDADPDQIDEIAEQTLAGRDLKTAGDVDAWCWEFLRRLDETQGTKKG